MPDDVFQVNGDMQLHEPSPFLRLKTSVGANSGINWKNSADGYTGAFFLDPSVGNFYLDVNGFSTNGAEAEFTFDADGEMGIGTNNPLAPLHIRGDGQALARFESGNHNWSVFTANNTGNFELFQNGVFKGRFLASDGSYTPTSDQNLKSNIQNIEGVLDRIRQLQPKTYSMKHDKSGREHIGFLAQDVEKVFPQMVYLGTVGNTEEQVYTMNYNSMAVVAIKGIQELMGEDDALAAKQEAMQAEMTSLQQENQSLKQNLSEMQERLNEMKAILEEVVLRQEACCQESSGIPIELKAAEAETLTGLRAELRQNTPNPFFHETRISYYIPETSTAAFLRITDSSGRVLKQIELLESGEGTLELDVQQMPAGTYAYSLFVDGQLVQTRQMIIGKN